MATNYGSAEAYPILKVTGPGQLYEITNVTTNETIIFNYRIVAGETVTLDLRPGKKTFTSTFNGDIINAIVKGSDVESFHLLPGENQILILIDGSPTACQLYWETRHWSFDGVVEAY